MKRSVWLYGLGIAIIAVLLRVVEYRYTLWDLSISSLVFIITLIFMEVFPIGLLVCLLAAWLLRTPAAKA